jgi:LacI family transcriptional regulator
MKKQNLTIHDIARELNISASTVSRALNNNPRISEATRNEVKAAALRTGYQPNNLASNLRRGKSFTAGVIVPRINRVFFSNVIGGIEEVLTPQGYTITICQSMESYANEVNSLKTLNNLRVDGIIMSIAAESENSEHIKTWLDQGHKIICFDRVAEDLDISSVRLNDFKGAYQTVKHLIDQGYKKIAFFSGPEHLNVYRDRKAGYLTALADYGVPVHGDLVIINCLTKEKGIEAARIMLKSDNIPDAIFSSSDFSAIGAMLTAREMGFKIPQDIGIAGFANEPFTELVSPSLTSVDQDSIKMGRVAAKVFLNSIDDKFDPKWKEKIVLEPKLIIRESSNRKILKLSDN